MDGCLCWVILLFVRIFVVSAIFTQSLVFHEPPDGATELQTLVVLNRLKCGIACVISTGCKYVSAQPLVNGSFACTLFKAVVGGTFQVFDGCPEALNNASISTDRTVMIRPLVSNPNAETLRVVCSREHGTAVSIFNHDMMSTMRWEQPLTGVSLTYHAKMSDIDFVKANSVSCKQFLRLDCYNAKLSTPGGVSWRSEATPNYNFFPSKYQISGLVECECSWREACCCGKNRRPCACDDTTVSDVLKTGDEGYNVNKNRVPFTRFSFSFNNANSYIDATFGRLTCVN